MNIDQYLHFLLNFYSVLSVMSFARIKKDTRTDLHPLLVASCPNKVQLFNYHLCCDIGSVCYISKKLATKNMHKIEEILNHENYAQCLLSATFNHSSVVFFLYDIYGKVIFKQKVKFTTINWF